MLIKKGRKERRRVDDWHVQKGGPAPELVWTVVGVIEPRRKTDRESQCCTSSRISLFVSICIYLFFLF
ncbi:hypothetical protein RIF29_41718 [Crotalaria pallida]|uniref:Uncharacterized protein n=1 Tax=Crotalaria pallida TaxID=3830 RepID=A0AAN9E8L6_CROPI